jgi:hypothetical protein
VCSRLNIYVSLLTSRSARDCSTISNILRLLIGSMKLSAQVCLRYTHSYFKRQDFSVITFRLNVLIFCNFTPKINIFKMSDRKCAHTQNLCDTLRGVFFSLWMLAIQRPGRQNLTWFWTDGHDCPQIRENKSPDNEKIRSIELVTGIERHDAVQSKTILCQLAEKDNKSYIFAGIWKLMRTGIVSYDTFFKWVPTLTRPPIPICLSAQDLSTADLEKAHLTKGELWVLTKVLHHVSAQNVPTTTVKAIGLSAGSPVSATANT